MESSIFFEGRTSGFGFGVPKGLYTPQTPLSLVTHEDNDYLNDNHKDFQY